MEKKLHRNFLKVSFLLVCFISFGDYVPAQPPALKFTSYVSGFSSPLDIKNAGDGSNRLFVVEQSGKIKIIKNGSALSRPFIDLASVISFGGEQGLLSVAFPPLYKQHGFFFVYYTDKSGNVTLARYRVSSNADSANPNSGVILFSFPKPGGFTNHNGGCLQFDKSGLLYIGLGDGGSGGDPFGNGQNGQVFFGKMLRLDVRSNTPPYYKIPPNNPFVNDPNVNDEIFALGLRNPWRWSFDRLTGDMYIGDVGQDKREEVDFRLKSQSAGANYGWRCYEGIADYNTSGCLAKDNYIFPVFDYTHNFTSGGYSITGGYVYRGSLYPSLYGYYIFADYITAKAWRMKQNTGGTWDVFRQDNGVPNSVATFGEDESGELYAASLQGTVYKISPASEPAASNSGKYAASVYPTIAENKVINIISRKKYKDAKITDLAGNVMLAKQMNSLTGNIRWELSALKAGTYMLILTGNDNIAEAHKIIIPE